MQFYTHFLPVDDSEFINQALVEESGAEFLPCNFAGGWAA
jgi:hypothetical protein